MFKYQKLKDRCKVIIDGEMTIYTVAELKQKFDEILADRDDLEIDLNGVTEIDSAGIQLLMLAKKSRDGESHALSLVNHSRPVLETLETMGLVPYFGDQVFIAYI
jgi:anti-anti-sigma factor